MNKEKLNNHATVDRKKIFSRCWKMARTKNSRHNDT